jgi:hypothetical protein
MAFKGNNCCIEGLLLLTACAGGEPGLLSGCEPG